jgi:hypothetical protein
MGSWGWPRATGSGVAIGPPLVDLGVAARHPRQPLRVAGGPPLSYPFFFFVFVFVSVIFIFYFLFFNF